MLRFEVFTAVTVKNAVFWEVASCSRWFLAREFVYPGDGGDTILRNINKTYILLVFMQSRICWFYEKLVGNVGTVV
jgi:hypothetical protein